VALIFMDMGLGAMAMAMAMDTDMAMDMDMAADMGEVIIWRRGREFLAGLGS
jgi:hypothetical protein